MPSHHCLEEVTSVETFYSFDVVRTVVFRASGNFGYPPVECKVIRTRAYRLSNGEVQFFELTTGHNIYEFDRWFEGWCSGDNFSRLVEIAVPTWAYQAMMDMVGYMPRQVGYSPTQQKRLKASGRRWRNGAARDIEAPIAAIMIDDTWEFPLPQRIPPNLRPAPRP